MPEPKQKDHSSSTDESQPLSEAIYAQLKDQINSLRLQPGLPLREVELAERFETSRTPVREALLRLNAEGFVDMVPGRGASVSQVSIRTVLEAYEIRELLEPHAVFKASHRGIDQSLASEILERLSELPDYPRTPEETETREKLDNDFHSLFIDASGNELIKEIVTNMRALMARVFGIMGGHGRFHQAKLEHQAILQAVLNGQGMQASDLMREHLRNSKARLFEMGGSPPRAEENRANDRDW